MQDDLRAIYTIKSDTHKGLDKANERLLSKTTHPENCHIDLLSNLGVYAFYLSKTEWNFKYVRKTRMPSL